MHDMFNNLHVNIVKISLITSALILLNTSVIKYDFALVISALGVFLWLFNCIYFRQKIYVPASNSFKILFAFCIVIILSDILNIENVFNVTFKGFSAEQIAINTAASFMATILISVYVFNVLKRNFNSITLINMLEKMMLLSLIIMGGYSFFELLSLLGVVEARGIVNLIDGILRKESVENDIFNYFRIRSLTYEASIFGTYCGVVFPWLLMKCIDKKISVYARLFFSAVFVYFIILVIFSFYRTAYFSIAIEFFLILFFLTKKNKISWKRVFIYFCMSVGIIIVLVYLFTEYVLSQSILSNIDVWGVFESLTDSSGNSTQYLSNVARFSTQVAAFNMFLDNPLFGIGCGQFPFSYQYYVPYWAWESIEVVNWSTNFVEDGLNGCFGIYVRILAECGIVGELLWLVFLLLLFKEVYYAQLAGNGKICLIVSLVALVLYGWNFSEFRLMYYWFFFPVVWMLDDNCGDE